MGLTSLQVCMDSSEWLLGTVHEDSSGMDSSSSPSGDMLACSRPLAERRLRPPHDQALNCPRCDSTHTKFCYYNNYSLSQPRYFCKTCRRYWTKGGTLRNIPVGGGCRKNNSNKKLSSKHKPNATVSSAGAPTDLHLSSLLEAHHHHLLNNNNFMVDSNVINPRNYDFMGNNNVGDDHVSGFHGISSPFGFMGLDHGNNNNIGTGIFPYEVSHQEQQSAIDVKPKVLSLEWQDQQQLQGCCDIGNDSFGYGIGSWAGMFNSYGSSTANPLV